MSARFRFHSPLDGLNVIERLPIKDQRGFLERMFCADTFREIGVAKPIVQINRTLTVRKATVRGMHFQFPPHAETKIICCLRGEVFDVAVDLRAGSPTFLHWHGEILSGGNARMLCIPEGFAHGFQTLSDDCEMLYFHTAAYASGAEGGVSPIDTRVGIMWPLPLGELSERDAGHPPLTQNYAGITI
ncbi:MAG: dTDP-4-dehydrorhamnose 3,5-epimerase [Nevskia sp.]|nr:dTDP-4-dehydrorhamnose 3,5-epimerase [Nevskia sp.]